MNLVRILCVKRAGKRGNGEVSGSGHGVVCVVCVGERKKEEEEKERTLLSFLSPSTALTQKISLIFRKEQIMRSGILISKGVIGKSAKQMKFKASHAPAPNYGVIRDEKGGEMEEVKAHTKSADHSPPLF